MALIANVSNGNTISTTWGNAIRDQGVQVTTSGARPGSPTEGMCIYETDTDLLLVYNGSDWKQIGNSATSNTFGAWASWTPQIRQSASAGMSTTVSYGKYAIIGKTCIAQCRLVAGAAGTAAQTIYVLSNGTLPAPAYYGMVVGHGMIFDISASADTVEVYITDALGGGADPEFAFYKDGSTSLMTTPTLASGDTINLQAIYEVA